MGKEGFYFATMYALGISLGAPYYFGSFDDMFELTPEEKEISRLVSVLNQIKDKKNA